MRHLPRPPALSPTELIELTRFFADEVTRERYPFIAYDAQRRWHQRIYRDPRIDIWLLSWLPAQGTELHDHGGSAGAFTVLSGVLSEVVHRPGRSADPLVESARQAGESVGFGPRYVHDVRNLGTEPALSVHAYSRPLALMNYYELDGDRLRRLRSVATEDPEPVLDRALAGVPS
jgi:predicted metal-dependent enzyme (double-stranded beta helix superfamily)